MSVDDPAALSALLPHLASLLAEVPLDTPVAVGVSRPAPGDVELAFRHLDCADVVCALGGFVAPADWRAFGVVAPGLAVRADDLHGARAPEPPAHRSAEAPGGTAVVACALVDRAGRVVSDVRGPDGASWSSGPSQGRVVDTCRRVLGLATAPPPFGTEVWRALHWVDRVLAAVLEADLGTPPTWRALDALDRVDHLAPPGPAEADDVTSWPTLRRACIRGTVAFPGIAPGTAAWMDDGMFAREAVGAFGPLGVVLGDLRELLPPATFDRVVERVSDRLGA